MTQAIIMLTRNDVTVPDALEVFHQIKDTGVSNIGFKDMGLSREKYSRLVSTLKEQHMHTYFEIVSSDRQNTIQSAKAAEELGVEYLIGGKCYREVQQIAAAGDIHYYPYVGKIVGHPCVLEGSIEEIIAEAREYEHFRVDGLNLLAYRYDGDIKTLMRSVQSAVTVPMIIAGSVDSITKIKFLVQSNISAFTIGTALFEKSLVPEGSLRDQVQAVLTLTSP